MGKQSKFKILPKKLQAILPSAYALMSVIPLLIITSMLHRYSLIELFDSLFLTLIMVITVSCSLFGFWMLAHAINSIVRLESKARIIEKSGHLLNIEYDEENEVGSIVSSFNYVMYRLRKQVQELEKVNDQLKVLSITDELTGLYNFRSFKEFLSREISRSNRKGYSIALLMMDLDNFKQFNDDYGHFSGNEFLKAASEILKNHIRRYDIVARYGGDEFVLILPETDLKGGEHVVQRLQEVFSKTKIVLQTGEKKSISASFGLATMNCSYEAKCRPDQIVEAADQALLRAKRKGKGGLETFRMAS